jgi:hypothetical protein
MTEAEATTQQEIDKSIKAIREIDDLGESSAFQGYAAKIAQKAEEMAKTVLEGSIPAEAREELRLQRIGLLLGLRQLTADREGHASILRGHGIDV